jgi:peptidoglycan/xylan/chitin deacetylase (PgdA/CDA1 family)
MGVSRTTSLVAKAFRSSAQLSARRRARRVRVLCWHAIDDFQGDPVLEPYGVPPERFAEQLDLLSRAGWVFVSPEQVVQLLQGAGTVAPRALLVTFDDGYADLLDAATPELQRRHIEAVAFVSSAVDGSNSWDQSVGARPVTVLGADGFRALEARGIEIGSHGATHRPLPRLPRAELDAELASSAEALASLGVSRPRLFAYAYGAHDSVVADAARRAGYVAAFAADPGVLRGDGDRFTLPRVEVLRDDVGIRLLAKVALARQLPGPAMSAVRHARRVLGGRAARRIPAGAGGSPTEIGASHSTRRPSVP